MLKGISVQKLFGRFNYDITLKSGGINILTGPNGFGKSTLLRAIDCLGKGDMAEFIGLPAAEMHFIFGEGGFLFKKDGGDAIFGGGRIKNFERFINIGGDADIDELKKDSGYAEAKKELDSAAEKLGGVRLIGCDARESLNFGDAEEKRLKLFLELAGEKLTFKTVKENGGKLFFTDVRSGYILPYEKLSSGEKHLLTFYYLLIVESRGLSLLLLDEPEMSMHIAWQLKLVGDIGKIKESIGLPDIIMATHSPQILSGNFDLQTDLGELYED